MTSCPLCSERSMGKLLPCAKVHLLRCGCVFCSSVSPNGPNSGDVMQVAYGCPLIPRQGFRSGLLS